jgi:hypothetical protein
MTKVRFTALFALALAVAGALAPPALAGAGRPTSTAAPRGFGTPAQIPWGSVGSGWALSDWSAAPPGQRGTAYLVLTNEEGQRYIVLREEGLLAQASLLDWSGDGQRALFDIHTPTGRTTTFLVADVRTGAIEDDFVLPVAASTGFHSAAFTRPDGLAILVSSYTSHLVLTRYSLSGRPEVTYPSSFASIGKLTTDWVYKPDGTELAIGGQHGLAIVANDGATVRTVHLGDDALACVPQSWWSANVVLANCLVGPRLESRLFEFPVIGGGPKALTRSNVAPDYGDIGAWRVGAHVYVEVASACGYVYLARLDGAAPVMIHVPGVPAGHSVFVLGASDTSLAIRTVGACQGGSVLAWYTPSSNSTHVVLGPPATGGTLATTVVAVPRAG